MRRCEWSSFRRLLFLLLLLLIELGPAIAQAGKSFVLVPQLAVGDGWSADIFVTNQDSIRAEDLSISFYATETGVPLAVSTNLGDGPAFQFDLEGGTSQAVRVMGTGGLQVGYAVLRFPERVSVRTNLFVRWQTGGETVTQLGVPGQAPSHCFSFPVEYDPSKQVNMGVAVVLPVLDTTMTDPHNLVVSLIDQAGALFRTAVVTLPPGGHLARMLNENELFPGLTQFTGNVVISGSVPVNALALRLEGTVLGSVGVNSGPVVRSFMVNASATAEVEANDGPAQAMALTAPAHIAAAIGAPGDVDYFGFTGQSGEILTALTDTRGMASDVDTVLTLLGPSGTALATCDENGLLSSSDSFVQAVLPADGTYQVRVEERGSRGGASFGYKLHLTTSIPESPTPNPVLTSITPDTFALGSTVDVIVTGTDLQGVGDLLFSDAEGITVTNQQITPTKITARFDVWAGAFPGPRTLRVARGGFSNELTFTIVPASVAGKTPTISNLVVKTPVYVENWVDIHIAFDFTDPDADIRYVATDPDHARILFASACGSFAETGPVLNKGGQTSGTLSFTLRLTDYRSGNYTINLQLIDAAGNGSNVLSFVVAAWECAWEPADKRMLPESAPFLARSAKDHGPANLAASLPGRLRIMRGLVKRES